MLQGTHPIHRTLLEHILWKDKPFARGQAWVDLILLANHTRDEAMIRGIEYIIEKGQVFRSKLTLCNRWGWSRGKTDRFLTCLETMQMIEQRTVQYGTFITLLNYTRLHKYAFSSDTPNGTANKTPNEHPTDTQQDTYNNVKKENNVKNVKPLSKKQTVPEIKLFIDSWHIAYLNKFGSKYNFSGGKEGTLIKTMLSKYGYDKLRLLAKDFWNSTDQFIINSGYTIGIFHSQINKLQANKNNPAQKYTQAQLRNIKRMEEFENEQTRV